MEWLFKTNCQKAAHDAMAAAFTAIGKVFPWHYEADYRADEETLALLDTAGVRQEDHRFYVFKHSKCTHPAEKKMVICLVKTKNVWVATSAEISWISYHGCGNHRHLHNQIRFRFDYQWIEAYEEDCITQVEEASVPKARIVSQILDHPRQIPHDHKIPGKEYKKWDIMRWKLCHDCLDGFNGCNGHFCPRKRLKFP